jgi:hypothetical protein
MTALGLGELITKRLGRIPGYWTLAASLVAGIALIDSCVGLVLFSGGGVRALRMAGVALMLAGLVALIKGRSTVNLDCVPRIENAADGCFALVVLSVLAINLVIASAPSTKVDELHYHMLTPKRIVEDDRLILYRQPIESAIVSQMAYQIGLSPEHALGAPEAGNVLSWGLGGALVLLIAGVADWLAGAVAAVGLYASVWHVTSGPHALGDLAIVIAAILVLLAEEEIGVFAAVPRVILVSLACCTAALTKISLVPLAIAITALGAYRVKSGFLTAACVWLVLYGPCLVWTWLQCGSPFGPVGATLFRSSYFSTETLTLIPAIIAANQGGWKHLLQSVLPSFSLGTMAAFCGLWRSRVILALVCGQALLIAWLLPHDIRFLGGLQYVVLVLAARAIMPTAAGEFFVRRWWIPLCALCLPWLVVQLYYARPFLKVGAGILSRDAFEKQYIAFRDEFGKLDRVLPKNALIYAVGTRLPSYYAPRPLIFTLEDLQSHRPVYRFSVGDNNDVESTLTCTETIYENRLATAVAFRTPGRLPDTDALKVEFCRVSAFNKP